MKKFIVALLFTALPVVVNAAGGGIHLDEAPVNVHDQASLQRGAKLFVNYCLSCHSAAAMRYNRMGRDLGLSDEEVKANLMLIGDKIGDQMKVSMPAAQAANWFGKVPPDLSVMARSRGADYIYTYLRTFYKDESRPTGFNNAVLPNAGMPHVLWELQGIQEAVIETEEDHEGNKHEVITGYKLVTPGKMTSAEYNAAMGDLTNFMVYMAEPAALVRERIGWWVLFFLAILFVVAYALKKEYWRDVH